MDGGVVHDNMNRRPIYKEGRKVKKTNKELGIPEYKENVWLKDPTGGEGQYGTGLIYEPTTEHDPGSDKAKKAYREKMLKAKEAWEEKLKKKKKKRKAKKS